MRKLLIAVMAVIALSLRPSPVRADVPPRALQTKDKNEQVRIINIESNQLIIAGVALVLALGFGVVWFVRRHRRPPGSA